MCTTSLKTRNEDDIDTNYLKDKIIPLTKLCLFTSLRFVSVRLPLKHNGALYRLTKSFNKTVYHPVTKMPMGAQNCFC